MVIWMNFVLLKLLIANLLLALLIASPAYADKVENRAFMSTGAKIAYNVQGVGPGVVLVHGLTGSQKDLSLLAMDLADAGFRAIVFDVRGHGASDKPHCPTAYGERIVTDIRNLLDHLSIDSAHVIGYSMGGDIANKFREMYPNRTRSCVIGGAGLGVSRGWADEPHDFNQIANSLLNGHGFVPLLGLPGAISPGIASEKDVAATNKLMTSGADTAALSALLRTYKQLDVDRKKLKVNKVRTLIVVGSNDAEHASAIELHKSLPNSKLHVINGVNHFEAWTHKTFNKTVTAFVMDTAESK